jgi:hypothetical protein
VSLQQYCYHPRFCYYCYHCGGGPCAYAGLWLRHGKCCPRGCVQRPGCSLLSAVDGDPSQRHGRRQHHRRQK